MAGVLGKERGEVLGPYDLVLCSGTLIRHGIPEMVQAAAAGGFRGISVWPQDYRRARAEGWSDADLRRLIADHGLEVTDLDALLTWLPEEVDLARRFAQIEVADEAEFFRLAEALGGRTLNVVQGFGTSVDVDHAAEALAGLCDRAALRGLLVTLEFLPWSGIPDAATAWEIVRRSGRRNAALMLDSWHLFRSGGDERSLRGIPGARIGGVQINDAPAEGPGDAEESMQARLLPGEGDIPLTRILRALREMGVEAPTGVEVFSAELALLPPEEIGRRAGAAGRRALERARAEATA
jgi:sugar phosphate isomerase/epimerase